MEGIKGDNVTELFRNERLSSGNGRGSRREGWKGDGH